VFSTHITVFIKLITAFIKHVTAFIKLITAFVKLVAVFVALIAAFIKLVAAFIKLLFYSVHPFILFFLIKNVQGGRFRPVHPNKQTKNYEKTATTDERPKSSSPAGVPGNAEISG
jgi:hypothetical protein